MFGNHRPGNIHSGVLTPSVGYGIRGAIWYQGESNAGRAYQYRELFPLMIKSWREEWGLGDFPFYWVQLADFMAEKAEPAESAWAELREAQTMTMKALPNTGEAVIIDIGEGKDIHPKNKQDVAKRLARWALAETYKLPGIAARSPLYKSMEQQGSKIVLSFDNVASHAGSWRPFDVAEPRGFAIAGALAALGAEVVLVAGPVSEPTPAGVRRVDVETAREMLAACEAALPADIAVCVAAVADWRPAEVSTGKTKKVAGAAPPEIQLVENPDILATLSRRADRPALVVGFAAETETVEAHAQAKLERKGCDWIVANDVSRPGVMGGTANTVSIVSATGIERWEEAPKTEVAARLAARIAAALDRGPA
jgi:phosphopantothenoylcysteine synthetase/decarboxylase